MPENNWSEHQALLKSWGERLPSSASMQLEGRETTLTSGERHGTWFIRVEWVQDSLLRLAELGLTNPQPTRDEVSTDAVVSSRAGASNEVRFVSETLLGQRRTLARLPQDFLELQLAAAVQRALGYTVQNLTENYVHVANGRREEPRRPGLATSAVNGFFTTLSGHLITLSERGGLVGRDARTTRSLRPPRDEPQSDRASANTLRPVRRGAAVA